MDYSTAEGADYEDLPVQGQGAGGKAMLAFVLKAANACAVVVALLSWDYWSIRGHIDKHRVNNRLRFLSISTRIQSSFQTRYQNKMRTLMDIVRVPVCAKQNFLTTNPDDHVMSNKVPPCHANMVPSKSTPPDTL